MIFQNSLLYCSFISDLIQVDWHEIITRGIDDINKIFSSFYNKLDKIVNKHAPFKTLSKRRKKKEKTIQTVRDNKRNSDFDQNKKRLYMSGDRAQIKIIETQLANWYE